jgi:hypothetical protein
MLKPDKKRIHFNLVGAGHEDVDLTITVGIQKHPALDMDIAIDRIRQTETVLVGPDTVKAPRISRCRLESRFIHTLNPRGRPSNAFVDKDVEPNMD